MLREIQPYWKALAFFDIGVLRRVRLQLHQLAQLPAMAARSQLAPDPSDSSANMGWSAAEGRLISHTWEHQSHTYHVSLSLRDGGVRLSKSGEEQQLETATTFGQAFEQLQELLNQEGMDTSRFQVALPYQLPEGFGPDFRFEPLPQNALQEFEYWYSNAYLLISAMAAKDERSSALRCWPHHFDLASLITLEEHDDPEQVKSVNMGFSPGDDCYDLPYLYVTPWPLPDINPSLLPNLGGDGFWHTQDWTGSILTLAQLSASTDRKQQAKQAYAFASSALEFNQMLIPEA